MKVDRGALEAVTFVGVYLENYVCEYENLVIDSFQRNGKARGTGILHKIVRGPVK